MSLYSSLKHTLQYGTLSVALLTGLGAGHVSQKYETPQFQRMPREPCVLPFEHRQPEKPVDIPHPVYLGLAAIVIATAANYQRKRADSFIKQRPNNPKNFFGKED